VSGFLTTWGPIILLELYSALVVLKKHSQFGDLEPQKTCMPIWCLVDNWLHWPIQPWWSSWCSAFVWWIYTWWCCNQEKKLLQCDSSYHHVCRRPHLPMCEWLIINCQLQSPWTHWQCDSNIITNAWAWANLVQCSWTHKYTRKWWPTGYQAFPSWKYTASVPPWCEKSHFAEGSTLVSLHLLQKCPFVLASSCPWTHPPWKRYRILDVCLHANLHGLIVIETYFHSKESVFLSSGDHHLAKMLFGAFNDLCHDSRVDMWNLIAINIPNNGTLLPIDNLVGNAWVTWVQDKTHALECCGEQLIPEQSRLDTAIHGFE